MTKKKITENEIQISIYAKALSHPTRVSILDFLASLEGCYFGEIHKELTLSKATVSQHLKLLKKAGLIQGTIEFPKIKYCIDKENWTIAQNIFNDFFKQVQKSSISCKINN